YRPQEIQRRNSSASSECPACLMDRETRWWPQGYSHMARARRHAHVPRGRTVCRRDRALDEAAAEHARLPFGGVVEHAGLARRHAVLAVEEIDLDACPSPAQPRRLRRPGRAHLDEHLVPT